MRGNLLQKCSKGGFGRFDGKGFERGVICWCLPFIGEFKTLCIYIYKTKNCNKVDIFNTVFRQKYDKKRKRRIESTFIYLYLIITF